MSLIRRMKSLNMSPLIIRCTQILTPRFLTRLQRNWYCIQLLLTPIPSSAKMGQVKRHVEFNRNMIYADYFEITRPEVYSLTPSQSVLVNQYQPVIFSQSFSLSQFQLVSFSQLVPVCHCQPQVYSLTLRKSVLVHQYQSFSVSVSQFHSVSFSQLVSVYHCYSVSFSHLDLFSWRLMSSFN